MAPWWSASVADYSAALHRPVPGGLIEPALVASLSAELSRVGHPQALEPLLQHRVLATAHHVTPTNGPTFLALDAILTASGHPGVVAAYSGVAFSNSAWSGALSFSVDPEAVIQPGTATWRGFTAAARNRRQDAGQTEHRLSLIPSRWRDGLVYRHLEPPGLRQRLDDLQPAVRRCLAEPETDWPTWALRSCEAIQRVVLGRSIVYLDLNRVVADYLTRILQDAGHPIAQLLLQPQRHAALSDGRPWFYAQRLKKKAEKVELLRPDGRWLVGRGGTRLALEAGALQEALRAGQLCPGLMICFAVLGILNPLRCLGSFNQLAYQAEFAARFAALGLARPSEDGGPVLLTGRMLGADGPIYPLDRLARQRRIGPLESVPMSQLWTPIVDRLLRAPPP